MHRTMKIRSQGPRQRGADELSLDAIGVLFMYNSAQRTLDAI